MPVVVMISNPAAPRLTDEIAEDLRARWDGAPLRRLAPGVAAEFVVPARPADLDQAAAALRAEGVDLALVPEGGRRKRLLLADMDSTMIGQECIDELADLAGVGPQVAAVTARAMNGELEFEGALRERVALLAGHPAGLVDRVLAERITYTPGGRELVATMRAAGARAVLVSGGFTAFTAAVTAHLGFDAHHANRLDVDGERMAGTVAEPILGRQAKLDALHRISAEMGIETGAVVAVGDGANDLAMLGAAGLGVALHAKPVVAAQAQVRIDHGDLTALLYLQGFARSEFVTG